MVEFFKQILFYSGDHGITVGALVVFGILLLLWILFFRFLWQIVLPRFFRKHDISERPRRRLKISLILIFSTVLAIGVLYLLNFHIGVPITDTYTLTLTTVLKAILIFEIAHVSDWTLSRSLVGNPRTQEEGPSPRERKLNDPQIDMPRRSARKAIKYAVYAIALLFVIETLDINYSFSILEGEMQQRISISKILYAIFLILLSRVIAWVITSVVMSGYYDKRGLAKGSQYAINQLIKYVIYVLVILIALQSLGFNLSLVLGGLAALLVGVGLGLQQTFNDFAGGIILLFERSIEVGHVVEIDGMVGFVQRIGLRTSVIETRENIVVIVPNSDLVNDKVVNWSQVDNKAMFKIEVGVAYGSNTSLVKKLLLEAVNVNDYVLDYPQPFVRFRNFGDSALEFEVLFWSKHFIIIENIKSDIRFEIDKLFRANHVTIPFPQRDVHMFYPENKEPKDPA